MNDVIAGARVEGSIMMDDTDLNSPEIDPVLLRAQVGMVFQKPNPFPKSIFENVAYGPRIHGLASSKDELDHIVTDSLKRAGLWSEVSDRLNDKATGFPAASNSVSALHGRLRSAPLCCSWMNPVRPSIPSPLR